MADYPGLLPASQVTETEVPLFFFCFIHAHFWSPHTDGVFAGEVLEAEGRACSG